MAPGRRSLLSNRALRGTGSILDAFADPALACEITMQPVRRTRRAAILFSDISCRITPLASVSTSCRDEAVIAEPSRAPLT